MRESQPIARFKVRARATSSHPALEKIPAAPAGAERFGPYYVHESLGEGGMACVHRATRIDGTGTPVALKRMWSHLTEDRDFVDAFVQEARLSRLLHHDNIAHAHELGKHDGIYYIAMELVSGPTLEAVMRQSRTAAGAIPLPIIVAILIQVLDALDHVHNLHDELGRSLRLIHRDVSPGNIIISNTGAVKLIDFGIAKAARSRVQTQAGFIKGKLAYVAPEYTHGRLDARADLFAIGVVAHEMLTGHRLFLADTEVDTIHNVRALPIHPPSRTERKVTQELDSIVMTALQRDPDLRWQNAAAMRRALCGVADEIGRIDGRELRRWVAWAFTREPWSESGVGRLVEGLEHTRAKVAAPAPRSTEDVTRPAVALLRRAPVLKEAPAVDEDAPTYEDAPPTTPVPRREDTQLLGRRRRQRWTWALVILLVIVIALAVRTGLVADVIAAI